jgi:2-polyprenyl-6-methoxyphenol hydroxylase-like FAD-dependent oxidoreductase
MFHTEPDVVVVGAGPVGLFAALNVVSRGHRVRIIDKEWRPTAHSYALALHARSLELLEEFALLGPVLAASHRIRHVGFYEGSDRFAAVDLRALRRDHSFVAVLRQDVLERLLVDALAARGVKVLWNHELAQMDPSDDGVELAVDKLSREGLGYAVEHGEWVVQRSRTMRPAFVIGTDGHRSRVRSAVGIDWPEVGPVQQFAVFEFRTDTDLGDEMRVMLHDGLQNVVWPMPDGYCRWSFEVPGGDAPAVSRIKDRSDVQLGGVEYPVLAPEALGDLLRVRAPWFRGTIEELRWRLLVRFERRRATGLGKGRVWLAGDAAHMTGPVGVQSMNVGLREARDLAHAVCDVIEGRAGSERLATYEAERRAEWGFLLGQEGGVKARKGVEPRIAALVPGVEALLPASGGDLVELLGQLGLSVPA